MSNNPGVGTKDLQRAARYDRVELREGLTERSPKSCFMAKQRRTSSDITVSHEAQPLVQILDQSRQPIRAH